MKTIVTTFAMAALAVSLLYSQPSLKINKIDPSGYPNIKVEFTAKKNSDERLKLNKDFIEQDISITEKGIIKQGTVICPPASQSKFSTILVIDRSPSMKETIEPGVSKYDAAKSAAKQWINNLPAGRFECAILAFNKRNYLLTDFITDKGQLLKVLESPLLKPEDGTGTDYNAAFLYDPDNVDGALRIAEHASYPVYVVFLTDGMQDAGNDRRDVWVDKIIDKKAQVNATIYSVVLGTIEDFYIDRNVAPYSEAVYYKIKNKAELEKIYQDILADVMMVPVEPPCMFTFQSDCNGGGNVTLTIKNANYNLSATDSYVIDENLKPFLEFNPPILDLFLNTPPGQKKTVKVTVTPRNNAVSITDYSSSFNGYRITNFSPVNLNKNQPIEYEIEYTQPKDSLYHPCNIEFLGNICGARIINPSAGWIYSKPVDMGSTALGNKKTVLVNSVFCNNSGSEISITGVEITSGDAANFRIEDYEGKTKLANGECMNITFSFTPDVPKNFSSNYKVKTSKGDYTSPIMGSGIGNPEIASIDTLIFPTFLSCDNVGEIGKTFKIYNIGSLPLEIQTFTFEPDGIFSIIPSAPLTVQPNDSISLDVSYEPVKSGYLEAVLKIKSNASNIPEKSVIIKALIDSVYYSPAVSSINFGTLCPGRDSTIQLILNTPGMTVSDFVTIKVSDDLKPSNIENIDRMPIEPGKSSILNITVSGIDKRVYNGVINIVDDSCGISYDIPVAWKVDEPELKDLTALFTANVPQTDEKTITITNISSVDYYVSKIHFRNKEFYLKSAISFPIAIPANSFVTFDVVYKPDSEGSIESQMVFEGSPCGHTDSVKLVGSATASSVSIEIDKYEACLGEVIEVPVYLRKAVNFSGSKVSKVSFTVAFDGNLLQPVGLIPGQTVEGMTTVLKALAVAAQDNDQVIAILKFKVKEDAVSKTSALSITDYSNDDGAVYLNSKDGLFTVIPSRAAISIGKIQAYPGEKIEIPVKLTNVDFCDWEFHKTLKLKIKFNKTLIEGIKNSPATSISGEDRIADINIPLSPEIQSGYSAKYPFGTMLGNTNYTTIELLSAGFENGSLEYTAENGSLELIICNAGGSRLFDPANGIPPGIYFIDPSPAGNSAKIQLNTIEEGENTISIADIYGNTTTLASFNKIGLTEKEIDLTGFADGVYFVTLKTPTQFFSMKILVVK